MWLRKLLQITEAKRIKAIASSLLIDSSLWQSNFLTDQKALTWQVSTLRLIFLSVQSFSSGFLVIFLVI